VSGEVEILVDQIWVDVKTNQRVRVLYARPDEIDIAWTDVVARELYIPRATFRRRYRPELAA